MAKNNHKRLTFLVNSESFAWPFRRGKRAGKSDQLRTISWKFFSENSLGKSLYFHHFFEWILFIWKFDSFLIRKFYSFIIWIFVCLMIWKFDSFIIWKIRFFHNMRNQLSYNMKIQLFYNMKIRLQSQTSVFFNRIWLTTLQSRGVEKWFSDFRLNVCRTSGRTLLKLPIFD